jgi:hypothetical protein
MKARGMPSPDRADAVMMSLSAAPTVEMEPERTPGSEAAETLTGDLLSRRF